MQCFHCEERLEEISFEEALRRTRKYLLQRDLARNRDISDDSKQYYIRHYLGNDSLFLLFDLYRNRLKHGRSPKRFLVQPVRVTAVFNLPWLFFNIIASNMFHFRYTAFCPQCNCKCVPGKHFKEECEYNKEYFQILDDILTGEIVEKKSYYQKRAYDLLRQGKQSAFADLFLRKRSRELILDFCSVGFSVFLWIYLIVYVGFPMFLVLVEKLLHIDMYEWVFL